MTATAVRENNAFRVVQEAY